MEDDDHDQRRVLELLKRRCTPEERNAVHDHEGRVQQRQEHLQGIDHERTSIVFKYTYLADEKETGPAAYSSSVVRSFGSWPSARAFSTRRMILPLRVFGSTSMN